MKVESKITSPLSRAELKNIRSLQTKKGRRLEGRFIAEGIRILNEAVRFRFWPEAIYYSHDQIDERGVQLLDTFSDQGVGCRQISTKQLAEISDTETPQGMVGVFLTPEYESEQLFSGRHRIILICDQIADPGNLGTLFRSALAFDATAVILTGSGAEAYAPKVLRASAGTLFGLEIVRLSTTHAVAMSHSNGFTIIAADSEGQPLAQSMESMLTDKKVVIAIGSEAEGLSNEIISSANMTVRIGHSAKVESLNAAVAGSILLKEVYVFLGKEKQNV
ncbi:MAG: RNA methyltransferase [candidate division Zixibacteria bacterium]|nr:RNA methyltransferase [candidate division Zixibacteria bacterium]